MSARDLALALLIVTIWGANFTVIRLGLDGVPPLLLAALRFAFVAVPWVLVARRPAIEARYWVIYGLTAGVGQFGCLFYAMHIGMPAGVASVVMQSQAVFTIALAALFLREPISRRQLLGLAVAALGLYLVSGGPAGGAPAAVPPAALLLTIASAAWWGVSNIVVRLATARAAALGLNLDMLGVTIWSSLVPPLPLLGLSLALDGRDAVIRAAVQADLTSAFAVAFLAYGATLFGFGMWNRLLARYPTGRIAPMSLLVPVTGILTAALVLDERLTWLQGLGCALVVAGLALTTLAPAAPARAAAGSARPR
nr:O-acetylserine/cysteine exporter [Bacillota bacterium]